MAKSSGLGSGAAITPAMPDPPDALQRAPVPGQPIAKPRDHEGPQTLGALDQPSVSDARITGPGPGRDPGTTWKAWESQMAPISLPSQNPLL